MGSKYFTGARLAAALTAAAVSLTGCVSMSDSGPPQQFKSGQTGLVQNQNYITPLPSGPQPGWTPEEIVSGFLVASASYYAHPSIAQSYLLPSAVKDLNPGSVTVATNVGQPFEDGLVSKGRVQKASVTVTGTVQATLNRFGQPAEAVGGSAGGALTAGFDLVKTNGQWRISQPPKQLLIISQDFQRSFQAQDLYFFDGGRNALVPSPLYVPLGTSAPTLFTRLVNALIAQPPPWLAGATSKVFPPGTTLIPAGTEAQGNIAVINLGGGIAKASYKTLQLVSAQLAWTLFGAPASQGQIQSVELEINGKPQTIGGLVVQTKKTYEMYDPYPSGPARFYYVDGGGHASSRCGAVNAAQSGFVGAENKIFGTGTEQSAPCTGWQTILPKFARPMSMVTVSANGQYVAGVSQNGDSVYIGSRANPQAPMVSTFPSTGSSLNVTSLSWDRDNDLWVTDNNGQVWVVPTTGKPNLVDVASMFGSGQVLAASVAPDGVRIAFIVQGATGTGAGDAGSRQSALYLASIQPCAPQQPLSDLHGNRSPPVCIGDNETPLGPGLWNPVALTWYTADNLIVIDRKPGSPAENVLEEVPVDGQLPTPLPVNPPGGAVSITADSTQNALVAGLAGGGLAFSAGLNGPWQSVEGVQRSTDKNPVYQNPQLSSGT